jgi:hypothetical protein
MALQKTFVNGFNTNQLYRVRACLRESRRWRKLISTQIAMQRGPFPGSSTVEHSAVNRRVASSNLARGAKSIKNSAKLFAVANIPFYELG